MYWLLEAATARRFEALEKSTDPAAFFAIFQNKPTEASILTRDGAEAVIDVKGVLTPEPDIFAEVFGGGNTSYKAIRDAIAKADADPDVDRIRFEIDSPGGAVAGLFETAEAIRGAAKPTRAMIGNTGASAAYALASQAGEVIAKGRGSWIGSVGVVRSFSVYPEDVDVTSSAAPNKRPDVTTDEGRAVVRAELDQIHDLMREAIAAGRGVTAEKIDADFGRGGMMLADAALAAGMIDRVGMMKESAPTASAAGEIETEGPRMDQTIDQAMIEGRAQEKARVLGHLGLAEKSGALDLAIAAIKSDAPVDASAFEAHLDAKARADELARREGDGEAVASAVDGATAPAAPAQTPRARVEAGVIALMGYKNEGEE